MLDGPACDASSNDVEATDPHWAPEGRKNLVAVWGGKISMRPINVQNMILLSSSILTP